MPKKKASDMTEEELLRKVLPKRVIEEAKREVSDSESPVKSNDSE